MNYLFFVFYNNVKSENKFILSYFDNFIHIFMDIFMPNHFTYCNKELQLFTTQIFLKTIKNSKLHFIFIM